MLWVDFGDSGSSDWEVTGDREQGTREEDYSFSLRRKGCWMHDSVGRVLQHPPSHAPREQGTALHTCKPSTKKMEPRESDVQGHPQLRVDFEAITGRMGHCLS